MKSAISIFVLAFLSVLSETSHSQAYSVSNPFQEALRNFSLKKNDIVVIAFVIPGECVKCNLALSSTFTWMKENMRKRQVKSVGFISCQREIELKQHVSNFPMFDLLLMDDGDVKKQMNLPSTTRVVICDHSGKVLGTIGHEEYFGDIQSAFKRILKIK